MPAPSNSVGSPHIRAEMNGTQSRTVPFQKGSFGESVDTYSEKYSMFIVPFIITLREGMEAIVLVGGIGINENTSVASIVISTFTAIIIGTIIGILSYRTGDSLSLRWFKMCSTGLLYLIAAGLFSKGVWNFELQKFIDCCEGFNVKETGHGPGSYDITKSVWHVICCNGELQDHGAF
ncbi:fts3-like protein [Yamadazyma tenuis]|uniref:fts3-like protein n=1 Tax=Candida tenuis TaxID=2315449 RepID=UPI0027A458E4|nr:fts3-like protein [Yamadazyma tenuis]